MFKTKLLPFVVLLAALLFSCRAQADLVTLDAARFGAAPNSGADATPVFQKALQEAAKHSGGVLLRVPKGRYDFFPQSAAKLQIFPSNLMDESGPRSVALDLQQLDNLTIDGQGSLFVMRGKISILAAQNCRNLTLKNIAFDYAEPPVAEIRVLESGADSWLGEVHPDSPYRIDGNNLVFSGESWKGARNFCVRYDARSTRTRYAGGNADPLNGVLSISQERPRVLRFAMNRDPQLTVGDSYQYRNTRRENVGLWFSLCQDLRLDDVAVYASDAFSVLAQQCENIAIDRFFGGPRPGSGRTASAWADVFHFTLCKGKIEIRDSVMSHTQDDAINVQGINFQIKEQPAPDQLVVRFTHPQAWGFQPFFAGDDIAFVRASSLRDFGAAKVVNAKMQNPKEILITLDRAAPTGIALGKDCVEPVTWNPSLHVSSCQVEAINTRGFLISTRQPVVIENTSFSTNMASILIADDANSWFESGPVRDVTIRNNVFKGLSHPAIDVHPEVRVGDGPVHRNIRIEDNTFIDAQAGDIALSYVDDVRVFGNRFVVASDTLPAPESFVRRSNASGVALQNNVVEQAR
jgi:hypothetical protein